MPTAWVVPVFVDIRPDNLNIDESKLKQQSPQAKAIVLMLCLWLRETLVEIAQRHHLLVIEDTQGQLHKRQPLGSIGHLATIFNETKM